MKISSMEAIDRSMRKVRDLTAAEIEKKLSEGIVIATIENGKMVSCQQVEVKEVKTAVVKSKPVRSRKLPSSPTQFIKNAKLTQAAG